MLQKLFKEKMLKCSKKDVTPDNRLMALASLLLGICWVASYRYRYNVGVFNTAGVNIWALALWLPTGYLTLQLYFHIRKRVHNIAISFLLTWSIYLPVLLFAEYLGYYVLNIREQSATASDSLVLGLIHGTTTLHTYYLSFPAIIIIVYRTTAVVFANRPVVPTAQQDLELSKA